jgi:hypothetical protein
MYALDRDIFEGLLPVNNIFLKNSNSEQSIIKYMGICKEIDKNKSLKSFVCVCVCVCRNRGQFPNKLIFQLRDYCFNIQVHWRLN